MNSEDGSGMVGKPAEDFSLQTIDGHQQKLSDLKGSVVIVDFWATWCPPCRESLPNLNRLGSDPALSGRGLKVLAVYSQESGEVVKNFLDTNHYTMPVLLDSHGDAERAYDVSGLPTTIIVGRDGVVKWATVGFDPQTTESQLSAAVEKALSEK
jgi:thiol-disulfide isomerase/thioredoxin